MSHIQILMGCGGALTRDPSPENFEARFKILQNSGIDHLDTAQIYGPSQELLGKYGAGQHFVIDTKAPGGFSPGSVAPDTLIANAKKSLETLKVKQVDVFYFHAPDESVPLADQLRGLNELHKQGAFRRFGLSNFTVQQVQAVYDHCKEHGYVLPSVYQGNYNPVARHMEERLLPTLRKLGFSFNAYSPMAGGFLTKTRAQIEEGAGRFNTEGAGSVMYTEMYARPKLLAALEKWEAIAKAEGVGRAELANRWVACSSALAKQNGDGIIVGANSAERLQESIDQIKRGQLSDKAVREIDEIWELVKDEAPMDNFAR